MKRQKTQYTCTSRPHLPASWSNDVSLFVLGCSKTQITNKAPDGPDVNGAARPGLPFIDCEGCRCYLIDEVFLTSASVGAVFRNASKMLSVGAVQEV